MATALMVQDDGPPKGSLARVERELRRAVSPRT